MTTKGTTTERAIRKNSAPINHLGPVSWIPAFAGMTAEAGMPVKGTTTERAIHQNSASINRLGFVSWIPAFAGMTTGDGNGKAGLE